MNGLTYERAIQEAAQIYVDAIARRDSLTPELAAEEAYVPGGPSIEELTQLIRDMRAEPSTRTLRAS